MMKIPRRYIPCWAWPATLLVSSVVIFGGLALWFSHGEWWLLASGLSGVAYTFVGYVRDVALYKPDLGDLRAVNGTPELEAIRHAAVLRARQEIYAATHVNSRTYIVRKMGFSGNAGQ